MWRIDPNLDLVLRRIRRDDVDALTDLAVRAFNSAHTGAALRTMLEIYFSQGRGDVPIEGQNNTFVPITYYLLASAEWPVALSGLYRRVWDSENAGNYWLGWFGVDPAFQRQGYGDLMLRATMSVCVAKGGKRLSIETSPGLDSAVRLYRRLGFTEVPAIPDYWGQGADLLLFYKNLTPGDPAIPYLPEGTDL